MAIRNIALVNRSSRSMDEVRKVAAGIQQQVIRDLAFHWNHTGAVIALTDSEPIPPSYWAIYLYNQLSDPRYSGIHYFTNSGEAYANVEVANEKYWSIYASHEALEMICDPTTDFKVPGNSLVKAGETVEYLMEICDPVQHISDGYDIDNVWVSDFCLPDYYALPSKAPGQYTFKNRLAKRYQIRPGGYLCWRDKQLRWFMATHTGQANIVNVNPIPGFVNLAGDSIREMIDNYTAPLALTGALADLDDQGNIRTAAVLAEFDKKCQELDQYGVKRAKEQLAHHKRMEKIVSKGKRFAAPVTTRKTCVI